MKTYLELLNEGTTNSELNVEYNTNFADVYITKSNSKLIMFIISEDEEGNELKDGPIGYIDKIFVPKEDRRKGIGSELIKKAIEIAKSKNLKKIELVADDIGEGTPTTELVKFYEKLGFTKVGFGGHSQSMVYELN